MGCSGSKNIEFIEIVDKCSAPGVRFSEQIVSINGSNRNVASWLPEEGTPKGIVMVSHGLNEHSLCYYGVAIALVSKNYAVFAIDHASHGKSDGRRGIIQDHKRLYADFIELSNQKKSEYPDLPLFVVSHSMGTLIAMMSINKIKDASAIVFSGAALFPGPAAASPFGIRCLFPLGQTSCLQSLVSVTAACDPAGSAAPIVVTEITSDPVWLDVMNHDPRRFQPYVTNKTAYELLRLVNEVKAEVPNLTIPFLCIHGSADQIALVTGSEYIYRHAGTDITQRKLSIKDNLKHECFHETAPHDQESIQEVVDFIEMHFARH